MSRIASQVLLALAATACAFGAHTPQEIKNSVRLVERLEKTCCEYDGPQLTALLAALGREATTLYEVDNCDAALDSILFAAALQRTGLQPLYGIQPGIADATVRRPSDNEQPLVPLKDAKLVWMMVSLTNLSDAELDLNGIKIAVERDGMKVAEALPPDAPELLGLPENVRRLALMPKIAPHGAAAFIAFFPRFNRWTAMTFTHHDKLNLCVRNYADMPQHLDRVLAARERAAKIQREPALTAPEIQPREPKPAVPKFELVGYIRNQVQQGRYGIRLVRSDAIEPETRLIVRRNDTSYAELSPIGSGTIAELISGGEPEPGDAVFIETPSEVMK